MSTYTATEFNRLPPLLTKKEFMAATGLGDRAIARMVHAGQLARWPAQGHKGKYPKATADKIREGK